jgi:uncharacterized protein YecE (DUF72 family)
MTKTGTIYCGIGGWTYEPWRGVFYPKGLPQARELVYAAEHLTAIEINGTFYRTQTPATFRKWASEVPDSFMFSVKGPRYAVNRRVLAEAGDSIKRFLESGVTELGSHLGPLLWQFTPYKKFDEADFGKFLEFLPPKFDGRTLRHVVEVRNDSFKTPAFIALVRKFGIGIVYAEHDKYTEVAESRLSAEGTRSMGEARGDLGVGRRAEGSAEGRQEGRAEKAARCLSLFHPRSEAARTGGSDGADREAKMSCENENDHLRKGAVTSAVARLVVAANKRYKLLSVCHLRPI